MLKELCAHVISCLVAVPVYTNAFRCGLGWTFALQQYTPEWRDGRKAFHTEFNATAITTYRPAMLRETHKLLWSLLKSPEKFMSHTKKYVSSLKRV